LSLVACLAQLYFSILSYKRHDFPTNIIEHKMCFVFPTFSLWKFSHSTKTSARYYSQCTQVVIRSTLYSYHISLKLEFAWQIFKKSSNTKFRKDQSSGSRVVSCEQRGRRTDAQIWWSLKVTFVILQTRPKNPSNCLSWVGFKDLIPIS
jgi:hypothetical protein